MSESQKNRAAITLVRVVQTCWACPSQWDAWDVDGQTYYLRYRSGVGTVEAVLTPTTTPESLNDARLVARFQHDDRLAGYIELEEFCRLAGISLAPDGEVVSQHGGTYAHEDHRTARLTAEFPELVDRVHEYEERLRQDPFLRPDYMPAPVNSGPIALKRREGGGRPS